MYGERGSGNTNRESKKLAFLKWSQAYGKHRAGISLNAGHGPTTARDGPRERSSRENETAGDWEGRVLYRVLCRLPQDRSAGCCKGYCCRLATSGGIRRKYASTETATRWRNSCTGTALSSFLLRQMLRFCFTLPSTIQCWPVLTTYGRVYERAETYINWSVLR